MSEFQLREFVCRYCGHTVVVNPKLPPDYTPNVCTPCWNVHCRPEHEKAMAKIGKGLRELFKMMELEGATE